MWSVRLSTPLSEDLAQAEARAISFQSLKRSCYEEAMATAQHGTSVAAVLGALFLALLLAALDQTIPWIT